MGLAPDATAMLFGVVSRLTEQKGVDLMLDALDALLDAGAQLAVLGSGDKTLEARLRDAAAAHPGRVAVQNSFDEGLAHLIEAGADCFLMPSRFEPCGLNQMYSMVYGTPVLAHATGGAWPTPSQTPTTRPRATASSCARPTRRALRDALKRAQAAYADVRRWRAIQRRCMAMDFGWAASTETYVALYRSLLRSSPR